MRIFPALTSFLLVLMVAACDADSSYQPIGEEVFPTVAVDDAALFRMDQLPISPAYFQNRWTWVGFGHSDCNATCEAVLDQLNRVEQDQTLFVVTDMAVHQRLRELGREYPMVSIGMGITAMSYDLFAAQFAAPDDGEQAALLFLVDPRGQLVYHLPVAQLDPGMLDRELAHARSLID
jgi:hypothetical protein